MASISANVVSFQALSKSSINKTSQGNGSPSIVTLGWEKSRFATLRNTRLSISCAAKAETVEKVCGIVRKQLALPAETEVTADTTFTKLGADSLDTFREAKLFTGIKEGWRFKYIFQMVEIVMALEEEFDITVEEDNAQNITNIQEAAEVIDNLVAKKA